MFLKFVFGVCKKWCCKTGDCIVGGLEWRCKEEEEEEEEGEVERKLGWQDLNLQRSLVFLIERGYRKGPGSHRQQSIMFVLTVLQDTLRIPPHNLSLPLQDALTQQICSLYFDKVVSPKLVIHSLRTPCLCPALNSFCLLCSDSCLIDLKWGKGVLQFLLDSWVVFRSSCCGW